MDFYLDFMRTLERSPDPEAALQELTETIKSTIEHAPARVALAEGAALLAVVHDYTNPKAIKTLPVFRDLMESVGLLMAALDADLDLEEHLWDENDAYIGPPQCANKSESEQLEGMSKHFLDFEHIESWGKARWAAFTDQVDMVVDIAATARSGLDSMVCLLLNIRNNFDKIPVDSQEQALIAADKLVLAIREGMENVMDSLQDKHQVELMTDVGDWDSWETPPDDFPEEPPDMDESAVVLKSELRPELDLSDWKNWDEGNWVIFDQAVADAQAAAAAESADPVPAMYLFLGIRQNIETLELHRQYGG